MKYMNEAIKEAYEGINNKHGGPFGAVIVRDGEIIGRGHNQVLINHDPTCHGEVMAIRDACKNIGHHDLSGCVLYTTAAPCPMCLGASLWANIDIIRYGCTIQDTDEIGFRDEIFYNRFEEGLMESDKVQIVGRDECKKLFADYVESTEERY